MRISRPRTSWVAPLLTHSGLLMLSKFGQIRFKAEIGWVARYLLAAGLSGICVCARPVGYHLSMSVYRKKLLKLLSLFLFTWKKWRMRLIFLSLTLVSFHLYSDSDGQWDPHCVWVPGVYLVSMVLLVHTDIDIGIDVRHWSRTGSDTEKESSCSPDTMWCLAVICWSSQSKTFKMRFVFSSLNYWSRYKEMVHWC